MAKRGLGSSGFKGGFEDARQAARQATGQKDTARAGQYRRKSYLLTDELIRRVRDTAEAQKVGINELVRYALARTMDGIDRGEIVLPVREEIKRKLEF